MVLDAVGRQPTALMAVSWMALGAVRRQRSDGISLDGFWCCRSATYKSCRSPLDGFRCCRLSTYISYGSLLDGFRCFRLATYKSLGSCFVGGVIGGIFSLCYAPVQMCLCFSELNLASLAPPPSEDGARV